MKGDVSNTLDRSMERIRPHAMDVCLGRGKSFLKNPGNVLLQDLVNTNRIRYFDSCKARKREITLNILSLIQETGRFLRFKNNEWIVISDVEAREKIAHAIQYRIRNDLSPLLSGVVSPDPTEPKSSTRAILPRKSAEKKMLELKEEHQIITGKNFQQSFKLSNPMTMSQMYCCNASCSSQYSTGEQEQEETCRYENVQTERCLEQVDVPQPALQHFDPFYLQATCAIQSVSDIVVDTHTFSPAPAVTVQHPLNSFTHEGQGAVSDDIHCKSYENVQINEKQQHHYLYWNNISSQTIQNSCLSTCHDRFPTMKLDASFDPLPLQQQHSFSSDVGDEVIRLINSWKPGILKK